jgi:hypothetical protein
LITVFSATNYEGKQNNRGAFLEISELANELLVQPNTYDPVSSASRWLPVLADTGLRRA